MEPLRILAGNTEKSKRSDSRKEDNEMMAELEKMGKAAREASLALGHFGTEIKDRGLRLAAEALLDGKEEILKANREDVWAAKEKGMAPGLVDRLMLNEDRIQGMADGLLQVAGLEDPKIGRASCRERVCQYV